MQTAVSRLRVVPTVSGAVLFASCALILVSACGGSDVAAVPTVARVDVTPAAPRLEVGATVQLTAAARDAQGATLARTITWATSNAAIATVSATGAAVAVAVGTVAISATASGVSGGVDLVVTPVAVASVDVSAAATNVTVGQTTPATAVLRDVRGAVLAGRTVVWTSATPAVATVSPSGVISAVAVGQATISATVEGKSGSVVITVIRVPVASVVLTMAPTVLASGQSAQGIATPRDAAGAALAGRIVTWTSSATTVASVTDSGRVLAVAAGVAIVTATSEGRSASVSVTVSGPPSDERVQVLRSMTEALPAQIASALTTNQDLLPNNPNSATQIQAKLTMLRVTTLANDISASGRNAATSVRSRDGRQIPIVTVFPLDTMARDARLGIGTVELALPLLETFFATPFPFGTVRVWSGFVIGNSGGGGQLFMEDNGTYTSRTPPSRAPYDALLTHELSHTYMGHESLTQFLEMYTYNLIRTGSADVSAWTWTRSYVPSLQANVGSAALLDVYTLIGRDAMARAYRAARVLNPPFGVTLSAAVQQLFVDEAPAALKAQVASLMARVTF